MMDAAQKLHAASVRDAEAWCPHDHRGREVLPSDGDAR